MVHRRDLLIGTGAMSLIGAGAVWAGVRQIGSMADYTAAISGLRAGLPAHPEAKDLIRFATLAANSHNTQAWQFRVAAGRIDILPDLTRATPVVDPDNHHLFVSLGCAAENLAIAAVSRGLPGELGFDAAQAGVSFAHTTGAATDRGLSDAILQRQSTRGLYDGSLLTTAELALLTNAARVPGVDLILITDRPQIDALSDLIATGNTAQLADPAFMAELKHWMRFSPRKALETSDGLFAATTGNPTLPDWLGPTMVDWVFKASSDNLKTAAKFASSAGFAVFVGARDDPEHWVLTGRACQRFALQATTMGLKHAFLNQPVEVPAQRAELATLLGMPGRRPDLVMRFGRGAAMPYSARRPVAAVMA